MTDDAGMRGSLLTLSLVLGVAILAGAAGLADHGSDPLAGVAWGVVSGAGVATVVGTTWRHRRENHPPAGESTFDSLGAANAVTLVRGGLVAGLAGLLVVDQPPAWSAALLYGGVGALDAVDGALARRLSRESRLGARLDMSVDGAGLLVASVVGVSSGALPPWYLLAGLARYAFVGGKRWRRRERRPVVELPTSRTRRVLAGLQMAVVPVALAPVVPLVVAWPLATVALVPFLANFWVDWCVVSGRRAEPLP